MRVRIKRIEDGRVRRDEMIEQSGREIDYTMTGNRRGKGVQVADHSLEITFLICLRSAEGQSVLVWVAWSLRFRTDYDGWQGDIATKAYCIL